MGWWRPKLCIREVLNLLRINNNTLSAIFSWPSTYRIRWLSVQNRSDLLIVIDDLLKDYPIIGDIVQSQ